MKIIEHKQLEIDNDLISLCKEIDAEGKTDDEWSEVESCDMFQSEKYCGGYDAIEQGFWFSYYDPSGKEWWFEITTASIPKIISGTLQYLDLHEPSK